MTNSALALLRRASTVAPLMLAWLLMSAAAANSQTTSGKLVGQVLDNAGKPIGSAKVTIVNENNGNTRATVTDSAGQYVVPFLTPGSYSITASLDGYTPAGVKGFIIPLNSTTDLRPPDITLSPIKSGQTPTPQPTSTTQTVSLEAKHVSMVNTSDPTRRANFTERELELLPLGGATAMRSFDELALLVPGISPPPYTPGVRGPGVGFGIGTAGQFSVNGARARSNNFTVDGSDNNDPDVGVRRQGFVALVPQSIESIQEMEISTLLWDAELGRNLGSQVNAVSKAGGNKYHGQAYGFFTDSRLNARNFFDYTGGPDGGKDPFTRVQSGFVFGGPIVKDKTQFFTSFEHQDINASTEQHFASPTPIERDLRSFIGQLTGATPTSFAVEHPFPSSNPGLIFGVAPGLGTTPLGANILSLYPLPNDPGGPYGRDTFSTILPSGGNGSVFSARINQEVGEKNSLSVRYNFTNDTRDLPSVNRAIDSAINSKTGTQDVSLILDSALSPNLYSQARFSYGRTRLRFSQLPQGPFQFSAASSVSVGSSRFVSQTGPIGELIVQPFSPIGVDVFTFPQARADNTFQYADSVSWKVRSHSIKFGADIRRVQLNSSQDRNYRPLVEYGNGALMSGNLVQTGPTSPIVFKPNGGVAPLPGIGLAALGVPSSIFQTITSGVPDSEIGLRFTEYNFFFNDNWRITSNFVLDYGIRYEYNSVPNEVNNRIEDALTLKNLPAPGTSSVNSPEFTAAFNSVVGAFKKIVDGRTEIYEPDYNNVAPHLGFAWDPFGDGKMSVRGGYGIYYDAILGSVVSQSRNIFPTEIPVNADPTFLGFNVFTLNNPVFVKRGNVPLILPGTQNQFGGAPQDFVGLLGSLFLQNGNGGGLAFTLPDKHLRTPYSQQWHLTIEREFARDYLVSVAYVGTTGTKLTRLTTPNVGPNLTIAVPVALGQGAPGAIFPLPSPTVIADSVSILRRSRAIPQLGAYQIFENSASSNYHALQVEARKRLSHGYTFTVAYTWSHAIDDTSDVFPLAGAPVLAEDQNNLRLDRGNAGFDLRHRFVTSLVWDLPLYRGETTGLARVFGGWQLGTVFQASSGQPFTLNLPIDANRDGNLTDRPSTEQGLIFTSGHNRQVVSIQPGLTVNNFFAFGEDGFIGRNTLRGDNFINWDLSLNKTFRFTESQSLEFRTDFFNFANRANFGLPIRTLGSPGFGSAVDTVNPARIIQFGLKYNF